MSNDRDRGNVKRGDSEVQALLLAEVRSFLREHGLSVRGQVVDATGQEPAADIMVKLEEVAQTHAQRRDWERRMVELGQLSAGVTHEARNVIAGVVGLTQLSLSRVQAASESGAVNPTELTETLQTIAKESQRGVELLTTYLGFANPREQSAQVVCIKDLIEPVLQLTAHEAKVRGCHVHAEIAPGLPELAVRATELREVLLNLVINALHATARDGSVQLVAEQPESRLVRIRVLDDGPGVPDELKKKIFDAFFTTKPAGQGTGLGLALALRVVKNHGGTITLHDRPEGGAEFRVSLPVQQDVYSLSEKAPAK